MFNRDALFGNRGGPPPPPRQQQPPPRDNRQQFTYDQEKARAPSSSSYGSMGGGNGLLQATNSPRDLYTFTNICAVNQQDVPMRNPSAAPVERDGTAFRGNDVYLLLNDRFVVTARPSPNDVRPGEIGLNQLQRLWMQVGASEAVKWERYVPQVQGSNAYLANMDIEIQLATNKGDASQPLDQDKISERFQRTFQDQMFAPGQHLLMDIASTKYKLKIKSVTLGDLTPSSTSIGEALQSTDPRARGIVTPATQIDWYPNPSAPVKISGSKRKPPPNAIVRPDFKFEDMGIGGLDKEFSDIFRRAFASRIFPPGLIQELGIQHVRGMLLYGPPGTGKTLIARQIGRMLNAREPKVINGPEVLNKYVGQSEENIRKLFADAEKEQKEKGDESGLHIIIFDELDAVCKQRGSGTGGGTGVGDSVVNQLLSKLDGVDQLNNILLIGMTNRKDMIDEALLRSGRLEVHVEISLPDAAGRKQILKIHTTKMRDFGKLANDVDISALADLTRNFSGAEISGLVKAASSFALQRHIKGGTIAAIKDDANDVCIHQRDFLTALEEVKPLFGVSEDELERCVDGGIIPFSPHIGKILHDGQQIIKQVGSGTTDLYSVLLYGPRASGKTALAARIALESKFPFIKMIQPKDMTGMNEIQKIQHIQKTFTDAYKSPLNVLVLDNLEKLLDWVSIGPRFSPALLSALNSLIESRPPKGRPLLIIVTSSNRTVLQQLDFQFSSEIAVPNVSSPRELGYILQESGQFSPEEVEQAVIRVEEDTDRINIGVKHVLSAVQTAMQVAPEDRASTVAEKLAQRISGTYQ